MPAIRGPAPASRSPLAFCATALATGLGSGYSPIIPGTAGSAVGLLLLWPQWAFHPLLRTAAIAVAFFLGVPAAAHVARRTGRKDPSVVVIDEVVGMWATLVCLPWTLATVAAGFLLFRALDVLKPFPARDLEDLPGGWGIMCDDLAAGIYANLLLRLGLLVVLPA